MPRRVKTMIVRPDGTLVEQVSDVPAAQPVKVATEKVPAAPALAEPKQLAANGPVTAGAPTNIADVNVARTTALTVAADAPASTASTGQSGVPAPNAPVPTARPSGQPVQVVAAVTSQGNVRNDLRPAQATATPVSAPAAAAAPVAQQAPAQQSGGYFIQIASLPTEADAQKSSRNLSSSKFAGVIGGAASTLPRQILPAREPSTGCGLLPATPVTKPLPCASGTVRGRRHLPDRPLRRFRLILNCGARLSPRFRFRPLRAFQS